MSYSLGDMFYADSTNSLALLHIGSEGQYLGVLNGMPKYMTLPQGNWTQTNISSPEYIKNKPSLALVATSGVYSDLSGKPVLSTVALTGLYSDLLSKPTLSPVASSGSYNDLINKPTIPSAQVQADYTQSLNSAVDYIKNKPNLSPVATTGAYSDLTGKPNLSSVAISGLYADLISKPNLATVATSGSYTDLINKPVASFNTPNFANVTTSTLLSSTRACLVFYSFPTSMTSILGSLSISATLQYADDSGFTTNVVNLPSDSTGCSGLLNLTLVGRLQVSGVIPAGKYRRVVLSQAGGATIPTTLSGSQEVLL